MAAIDLGIVYKPYFPAELAELSAVLAEITGETPTEEMIQGSAGPNDCIQIFVNVSPIDVGVGVGLAVLLRDEFCKEIAKQAAAEVWKRKRAFVDVVKNAASSVANRLAKAIQAFREKRQTVSIAVKIPGTWRNAALVITSDDAAEIAWHMMHVARSAEKIRGVVLARMKNNEFLLPERGTNEDLSIAIEVLDNGDVKVIGEVIEK